MWFNCQRWEVRFFFGSQIIWLEVPHSMKNTVDFDQTSILKHMKQEQWPNLSRLKSLVVEFEVAWSWCDLYEYFVEPDLLHYANDAEKSRQAPWTQQGGSKQSVSFTVIEQVQLSAITFTTDRSLLNTNISLFEGWRSAGLQRCSQWRDLTWRHVTSAGLNAASRAAARWQEHTVISQQVLVTERPLSPAPSVTVAVIGDRGRFKIHINVSDRSSFSSRASDPQLDQRSHQLFSPRCTMIGQSLFGRRGVADVSNVINLNFFWLFCSVTDHVFSLHSLIRLWKNKPSYCCHDDDDDDIKWFFLVVAWCNMLIYFFLSILAACFLIQSDDTFRYVSEGRCLQCSCSSFMHDWMYERGFLYVVYTDLCCTVTFLSGVLCTTQQ